MHEIRSVFVYGTLKQGGSREKAWPHLPQSIRIGYVRGILLDLGSYPGLLVGDDWIRGELYTLLPEQIVETLQVLDQIEDFDPQQENNLYVREIIPVFDRPDGTLIEEAYAYFLSRPSLKTRGQPIPFQLGEDGIYAEWNT